MCGYWLPGKDSCCLIQTNNSIHQSGQELDMIQVRDESELFSINLRYSFLHVYCLSLWDNQ